MKRSQTTRLGWTMGSGMATKRLQTFFRSICITSVKNLGRYAGGSVLRTGQLHAGPREKGRLRLPAFHITTTVAVRHWCNYWAVVWRLGRVRFQGRLCPCSPRLYIVGGTTLSLRVPASCFLFVLCTTYISGPLAACLVNGEGAWEVAPSSVR